MAPVLALIALFSLDATGASSLPCNEASPEVAKLVEQFTVLLKAMPKAQRRASPDYVVGGAQFGKRKRRTLTAPVYPFSAIGVVTREGAKKGRSCTGTLVGPCQVLTASHCVKYSDGELHPTFFQTFDGSKSISVKRVIQGAYISKEKNTEEDWAVLILDGAFGEQQRWLEVEKNPRNLVPANLIVAGYSGRNSDNRPTVDPFVSVLGKEKEGKVLLTNFSAGGGDSGSALLAFDRTTQKYQVVAVTAYAWYGDFPEKDAAHGTKMVLSTQFYSAVDAARKAACSK